MPDPSDPVIPPGQRVRTSTRLWSAEVAIADAGSGLPAKDIGYEWSNGRKFIDNPNKYQVPE